MDEEIKTDDKTLQIVRPQIEKKSLREAKFKIKSKYVNDQNFGFSLKILQISQLSLKYKI